MSVIAPTSTSQLLARDLGVDIAVDLKGFTQHARTNIFALRAAPIQVGFLGYPGTMGARYIDYLIADGTLVPETHRQHYVEAIAYLPNSYQPNDDMRHIAETVVQSSRFGIGGRPNSYSAVSTAATR